MAAKPRPAPKPVAAERDNPFDVADDGSITFRILGKVVYLRPPSVGEMLKIVEQHAAIVKAQSTIEGELRAASEALIAAAIADDEGNLPPAPEGIEDRATEMLVEHRTRVAEFWSGAIAELAVPQPSPPISAMDLPAFLSHPGSLARALEGWYGLPTVPGDG